jgi:hypothetical protein
MMKGTAAMPKPNAETAIPTVFLRLATKNNPNTISNIPRPTIPKAIGFICFPPLIASEYAGGYSRLIYWAF